MDKEEKNQKVALFRYSLIAPAITETFEAPSGTGKKSGARRAVLRSKTTELAQHFRNVAAKKHLHPDGSHAEVTFHSLERWHYAYKKHGLAGITPKARSDIGKPRALPDSAISRMHELREKYPCITGKAIYGKLIEEGIINAADTSLSTVHRYIKGNGLKAAPGQAEEVRAFEMEFVNDCWQTDSSTGPVIKIAGKKTQTFLFAFIDDKSRHILHAQFYASESAANMQDAFRRAIAKAGVPKMLYCDNGKAFSNLQLQYICASLGIALVHSKPYVARSRGKIERAFRTVKDGWMNATDWGLFSSLDGINASLSEHLSGKYTNSLHSAIKCTPKERFMRDYERIRHIPAEELNFHFLHRKECRVANDATIKAFKDVYEAPQQFVGAKIKIRYLPADVSELFIYSDDGKLLHTIRPVKKVENSKIKRALIDYTKAGGGA